MFIIKCAHLEEVWSNEINQSFIHRLPKKYFAKKLGRAVGEAELEVYYVEDEGDRMAGLLHHKKHLHEGVKLQAQNRKVDLVDIEEARVEPPQFKPGDDDPDDPGTPIAPNDPRTKPTNIPRKETKIKELSLKRVVSWERKMAKHKLLDGSEVERMTFMGNKLEP